MKKLTNIIPILLISLIASVCSSTSHENKIEGIWQGALKYPGVNFRIAFKITKSPGDTLIAIVYTPDGNDNKIPVSKISFKDSKLIIEVSALKARFEGEYISEERKIEGIWNQGELIKKLTLLPVSKIIRNKRSQTPVPPYPYTEVNVTFINKIENNIKLAGTLTFPEKGSSFPAVILIPGVGAHDRNYSIIGHEPFHVIADYLTRNGIAVLRYDERGVGESGGNRQNATSVDFASDVIAGIKFLKEKKNINPKQIGLIGHSEGGIVASIAAVNNPDVSFLIMMASPGLNGVDYNYQYEESVGRAYGLDENTLREKHLFQQKVFKVLLNNNSNDRKRKELIKIYKDYDPIIPLNKIEVAVKRFLSPWFLFNLKYEPQNFLSKINCPVLALFGENDIQVPPGRNKQAIEKILLDTGNKNFEVEVLPQLNHFFQTCRNGLPLEYGKLEETISPAVLQLVTKWIKERVLN